MVVFRDGTVFPFSRDLSVYGSGGFMPGLSLQYRKAANQEGTLWEVRLSTCGYLKLSDSLCLSKHMDGFV